ncbi:FAD binding domain protein [Zalerion maritima]|uniref:FAD binding domain protein n=1 Tax=Zalerion maritima TaxID=339359 RepID=A0AAD5RQ37_9PEZI|nr:FAD binding domain protein [Zalerion maritima]
MAPGFKKVIIVGAGPAGQLLGLLLAKYGIPTTIVEQSTDLDANPRATHYGPPAMKILNLAGVGEDLRTRGFAPDTVAWRQRDGTFITGISHGILKDDPERITALPLNQLGKLLLEHGKKQPLLEYLFNHRVTAIGQDELQAWVDVEHAETKETSRMTADYIVGCDGANSIVRRSLFGDWEFPGKTWDEQVIATNVYYDFAKYGYSDANFIVGPEHWHMASKITKDGMWRVSYGQLPALKLEEVTEQLPEKFRTMFPGHPGPDQYKLVSMSPYRIHQRLAKQMRVGRFLLAADAAHLCNPFGGLGLTGGIVDVGGLYECLVGIYDNKADSDILDVYSRVRREKYQQIIDPMSSDNLKRMFPADPDNVMETDEFFKVCKKAETDTELRLKMIKDSHNMSYDFTQHYR